MKNSPIPQKGERGQALIIITFAIIGLIGLTALTVDGSLAYSDRRHAQNAVDTAALAAARAQIRGENVTNAAQSIATSNGYDNDGSTNIVSVSVVDSPSGACPSTGHDITVNIESIVDTTFAKVIGVEDVTNNVMAKSRVCDVYGGQPFYSGNSVFATKTGECGNGLKDKTLYVQGSSDLQIWGGGMGSASTDGNCIDFRGGEAQLKKGENGACANVVSAAPVSEISDAEWDSLEGEDGCGKKIFAQAFDPPPADLNITCSGTATVDHGTMTAGNWSGDFPPANISTLGPGVYCINNGDFDINSNSNITGTGVTIIVNDGSLHWNGGAEIKLSAPKSGDTKGLLIYFPPDNHNDVDMNGNNNSKITGTVLAQNSDCFFAGTGQIQKQVLQFICSTWGIDGDGQAEIEYDSTEFYSPLINPTVILLQ